jgi:hypothetical protein
MKPYLATPLIPSSSRRRLQYRPRYPNSHPAQATAPPSSPAPQQAQQCSSSSSYPSHSAFAVNISNISASLMLSRQGNDRRVRGLRFLPGKASTTSTLHGRHRGDTPITRPLGRAASGRYSETAACMEARGRPPSSEKTCGRPQARAAGSWIRSCATRTSTWAGSWTT